MIWYYFFFGRHLWHVEDEIEDEGPHVAIFISEQRPDDEAATRLDSIDDSPISLREVLVSGRDLIRRRKDDVTSKMIYDRGVTSIQIARDFFAEVILNKLT